ncbi:MAG: RNA polymerase sigma factor [Saprospiraceae bacterium]|nr:RNA polymerase sigma factor [Saprospiraceae bacterium]
MDREQEQAWTRAAAQGDLVAYGHLVRLHQDMVFSLSLTLLKNRQDAEDLSQDVLVKVFRMLPQYRSEAPLKAWVYRITYHEGLNRLKKVRRERATLEVDDQTYYDHSVSAGILCVLDANDKRTLLRHALDQLSTQDQILVQAYYFKDMSVREISQMMRMTESNIKIKLHRSRKVLYQVLQKTLADEQAK